MPTVQDRIANLPRRIVVDLEGLNCKTRFGVVDPGEPGYQPLYVSPTLSIDDLDEIVASQNNTRKPTAAEREAAQFGSMFGWHVPGADPAYWEAELAKKEG